jgi:hypothetical protein
LWKPSTSTCRVRSAAINATPLLSMYYSVVPRAGIEPANLAAADFKSAVFTYFTNGAM